MTVAALCPACRRPLGTERFGERFTPLKAAIIDAIAAAGDAGISSEEILAGEVFRDRHARQSCVKSHVNQINDLLVATDWRIVSDRRRWFLVQRRP